MSFWLDTYTISNEPKCFTGEVFPFDVPQCKFHECGDGGDDVTAQLTEINECDYVDTWPLGLAELFLHNDVLNQAISGYAVHEEMHATPIRPPTEATWTGVSYSLTPNAQPRNPSDSQSADELTTWYDFDDFSGTAGYNGKLTISELPACGTLTALSLVEGEDYVYLTPGDDTSGVDWDATVTESRDVVMNMVVDVTVE